MYTHTLVRSDFVSDDKINNQSKVQVRCCHGDLRSYPTAKVQVTVDGRIYQVEAGVLSQLPQPVLLGRGVSVFPKLVQKKVSACLVLTRDGKEPLKKKKKGTVFGRMIYCIVGGTRWGVTRWTTWVWIS
jgi:hypothetical protein